MKLNELEQARDKAVREYRVNEGMLEQIQKKNKSLLRTIRGLNLLTDRVEDDYK